MQSLTKYLQIQTFPGFRIFSSHRIIKHKRSTDKFSHDLLRSVRLWILGNLEISKKITKILGIQHKYPSNLSQWKFV